MENPGPRQHRNVLRLIADYVLHDGSSQEPLLVFVKCLNNLLAVLPDAARDVVMGLRVEMAALRPP